MSRTCVLMATFGLCYKPLFPQARGGVVPIIISYVFSLKNKVYIMKIQYNYTHGRAGLEEVQQNSLIKQAPQPQKLHAVI